MSGLIEMVCTGGVSADHRYDFDELAGGRQVAARELVRQQRDEILHVLLQKGGTVRESARAHSAVRGGVVASVFYATGICCNVAIW